MGDRAATLRKAVAAIRRWDAARVTAVIPGAAGAVYDFGAATGYGAANLLAVVPATVGPITLNVPCKVGIVYVPGAAQVANIFWS